MSVYLMKSGKYFKIGISKNPKSRMVAIKTSSPLGVELIGYKQYTDDFQKEKSLHFKYRDSRVSGEWFLLSEEDVKDICVEFGVNHYFKSKKIDEVKESKVEFDDRQLIELFNNEIKKLKLDFNIKIDTINAKQEILLKHNHTHKPHTITHEPHTINRGLIPLFIPLSMIVGVTWLGYKLGYWNTLLNL